VLRPLPAAHHATVGEVSGAEGLRRLRGVPGGCAWACRVWRERRRGRHRAGAPAHGGSLGAGWWSRGFVVLPFWKAETGRFAVPVASERLPGSLLERFSETVAVKLLHAVCSVAPTETASWVRVVWSRAEDDI